MQAELKKEISRAKRASRNNYIIQHFRCFGLRHFRYKLLFKLGVIQDSTTEIRKGVYFDDPSKVHIGRHCLINTNTHFYTGVSNESSVSIGDNTKVGMDTIFITVTHEIGDTLSRAGKYKSESIIVGEGYWIGANSTILPGVNIGDGVIIGAGSVVNKDCLPNKLYAGCPAKLIKEL